MSSDRRPLIPSTQRRRDEDDDGVDRGGLARWVTIAAGVMVVGCLVVIGVVFARDTKTYPPSPSRPDHDLPDPTWDFPEPHYDHDPLSESVSWSSCGTADSVRCARLIVPLDYDNPSMGTANLSLVKMPHTKKPRLGTVFMNPGGPGGSGANAVWRLGKPLNDYLGGHYDLVSFDPRGINGSTPLATCFKTAEDEKRFLSVSPLDLGLPSILPGSRWDRDNVSETELLETIEDHYYDSLQTVAWLSRKCRETTPEIWDWMDTASVARDIIRMQDLIEGEGTNVNYWGLSYGTAVGQYLVNMFPDRMGRVILDGALDGQRWGHQSSIVLPEDQYRSAEDGLSAFCTWCAEAGDRCPLSQDIHRPTAEKIRARIDSFIVDLDESPRPVDLHVSSHQMYLTATDLQSALHTSLYKPLVMFVKIAESIAKTFLSGSDSGRAKAGALELFESVHKYPDSEPSYMPWAELGVECSDTLRSYPGEPASLRDAAKRSAAEAWHLLQDVSPHFGSVYPTSCPAWIPKQGGRPWEGPWSTRVKGRVLVIANEADPICPLFEARKVFAHYHQDATLLVRPSVGHCSLIEPSKQQAKIIQEWFNRDILPPRGQVVPCDTVQVNPWLQDDGKMHVDEEGTALDKTMRELAEVWGAMDVVLRRH